MKGLAVGVNAQYPDIQRNRQTRFAALGKHWNLTAGLAALSIVCLDI